jgi:integrase/recombinase XerC
LVEVESNVVSLRQAPAADLADRTLEQMLEGWRNQQLARNLAFATINGREAEIRRFVAAVAAFPWRWSAQMVDDWLSDQRAVKHLRQSTIRSKAITVKLFCDYVTDPAYGWPEECWERFGTHPVQVCHRWNTAAHVQEAEGQPRLRAFTVEELQALFDCADEMVVTTRAQGRKGWLSNYRDATLLKVAYAWGLRRREVQMLDVTDFGTNPAAPQFGRLGVIRVRHGKAMKGSAPKPRSVLSVFGWAADCLEEWLDEVRPLLGSNSNSALWPTERGGRVSYSRIEQHFRTVSREVGLDRQVTFHS